MFIIGKRSKKTEDDRAKEIAREREKQRKKMIRTRYGQKKKTHAKKGVQSCGIAAVCALLLTLMLTGAFRTRGEVSILVGFLAVIVLVASWRGLVYAVRGFKERDKNYITCKIGAVCNVLLLLGMCGIFIRGLF